MRQKQERPDVWDGFRNVKFWTLGLECADSHQKLDFRIEDFLRCTACSAPLQIQQDKPCDCSECELEGLFLNLRLLPHYVGSSDHDVTILPNCVKIRNFHLQENAQLRFKVIPAFELLANSITKKMSTRFVGQTGDWRMESKYQSDVITLKCV